MNKKLVKMLGAGILAFVLGAPAQAALIGVVDHDTYFSDTASGLDWLDVTASVNRSYNDVSTQFGVGGDFEGWRYASAAEFGSMYNNITGAGLGINAAAQDVSGEWGLVIDEVISMMGDTFDASWQFATGMSYCEFYPTMCPTGDKRYTRGIISDVKGDPAGGVHYAAQILNDDRGAAYNDDISTGGWNQDALAGYHYGSMLVRQMNGVPEPATITLFAMGLAGFGFSRRKSVAQPGRVGTFFVPTRNMTMARN